MLTRDRRGKFKIATNYYRSEEGLAAVRAVMAKCVITRCEMLYDQDCFEYFGCSEDFAQVEEGALSPEYMVYIDEVRDDDGYITDFKVGFIRK